MHGFIRNIDHIGAPLGIEMSEHNITPWQKQEVWQLQAASYKQECGALACSLRLIDPYPEFPSGSTP
ncbi:hypothetical protein Pgy4_36575, partial [Pseudomonas savastanoi pv. glycinea str. race 4]